MPIPYRTIPHLTEQDRIRFWQKVNQSPGLGPKGDCWEWTTGLFANGYGMFSIKGQPYVASRVALSLQEPISRWLEACHRCDNPPCVRPQHLFQGTRKINQGDMAEKGRAAKGLNNGKYTHPEKTPRGEQNGRSVLTEDIVRQILADRDRGMSRRAVARKYGVDKATASSIFAGRTWNHLFYLTPTI